MLKNRSSFLYGRKPAGTVPIYAFVKNCVSDARIVRNKQIIKNKMNADTTNDLKTQMTVRNRVQQVKYENRQVIINVIFKVLEI